MVAFKSAWSSPMAAGAEQHRFHARVRSQPPSIVFAIFHSMALFYPLNFALYRAKVWIPDHAPFVYLWHPDRATQLHYTVYLDEADIHGAAPNRWDTRTV